MKTILFKSLSLAIIGTSVTTTALSAYDVNHHLTNVKHNNSVGFADNNPIYYRSQQDSQGTDGVTLSDVTAQGFTLNYQISAATLAYFYPAIGTLVQPGDALYNLLTKGTDWDNPTHYWEPLKKENAFNTFIDPQLYVNYLFHFNYQLRNDFTWSPSLSPSFNMDVLQQAMQTGSGFDLKASVVTDGSNVDSVALASSVVANHYPPTAKTQGSDSVFGNMNEPNNVLKVNISATSCKVINDYYSRPADFISWLFSKQASRYPASKLLNYYINDSDSTKGFKYDLASHQLLPYWQTANWDSAYASIKKYFYKIIHFVYLYKHKNGITLLFSRDQAGKVKLKIKSQLPAYRIAYYNAQNAYSSSDRGFAFLTTQDIMALRLASFRYLTPKAEYTDKAYNNAMAWLFNQPPLWDDSNVVHSWSLGNYLSDPDQWGPAIKKWNWKNVDQFMAQAIIQDRGVVIQCNKTTNPADATISLYAQNAIPSKH